MTIEKKWKRYAVAWHLSDFEGDPAELFDALMACQDEDEVCDALEARGAIVWSMYEEHDLDDIVESIEDMARSLQDTANGAQFAD